MLAYNNSAGDYGSGGIATAIPSIWLPAFTYVFRKLYVPRERIRTQEQIDWAKNDSGSFRWRDGRLRPLEQTRTVCVAVEDAQVLHLKR